MNVIAAGLLTIGAVFVLFAAIDALRAWLRGAVVVDECSIVVIEHERGQS